jgi:hypothetical protein
MFPPFLLVNDVVDKLETIYKTGRAEPKLY